MKKKSSFSSIEGCKCFIPGRSDKETICRVAVARTGLVLVLSPKGWRDWWTTDVFEIKERLLLFGKIKRIRK